MLMTYSVGWLRISPRYDSHCEPCAPGPPRSSVGGPLSAVFRMAFATAPASSQNRRVRFYSPLRGLRHISAETRQTRRECGARNLE